MFHYFVVLIQAVKNKTETEAETVTEEMLDEDLKEEELSDNEEAPVVNEVETEEVQPANVSNKYEHFYKYNFFF